MVLSTEWSQVEIIDLINDGNGLGFMLVGGRSTGVVIKALIPGSVAERDGRLQSGDHVLQIGDVNLRGFSSEQVATVLRQSGQQVRLIVARPVEPTSPDYQALASHAPIIPTKMLTDPDELDRTLLQTAGYTSGAFLQPSGTLAPAALGLLAATTTTPTGDPAAGGVLCPTHIEVVAVNNSLNSNGTVGSLESTNGGTMALISPTSIALPALPPHQLHCQAISTITSLLADNGGESVMGELLGTPQSPQYSELDGVPPDTPETETYEVELRKNVYGLGITVAGYVCEEEDLSGIFVKSIIEGSAAEMSGKIAINDRIVAVDNRSLAGVTNHQAVEILRNTDIAVRLTLERFLRGRKYEHLQVALIDPMVPTTTAQCNATANVPASCHAPGERGRSNGTIHTTSHPSRVGSGGDLVGMVLSHSQTLSHCASQCQSQRCSIVQSPSATTLSICPARSDADSILTECGGYECGGIEPELESGTTFDSSVFALENGTEAPPSDGDELLPDADDTLDGVEDEHRVLYANGSVLAMVVSATTPLTTADSDSCDTRTARGRNDGAEPDPVVQRWSREVPHSQIVVADIRKLAGLGISLEGTVEVEGGVEVRPHHYIRSILEDGPVGRDGQLKPGDELLQVNEHRLQGLKHIEVVKILKELPAQVRVICARGSSPPTVINTSRNAEAFEARSILAGGLQSLQSLQGILTKAQSESSLYTSSTATLTDQQRSKSVEQVSGLALWTNEVLYCDIEKTERGFGFSILDYQDPLDTDGTVIVVRGLIPGGSAETTNFIFPGDRLVSVNGHSLQNATLDQAVSILKGIPLGPARIGLCRPLSTSDNNLSSTPETPTT
ncbi:patj homolog [Anopheles funestus]|uniref:patj homolog n=1 Tax=Anopheles funestus TaxID=62324 RepID=UPI0020C73EBB|nr:patj homolog [Anopheles funestus]XP_049286696.1 patj homolog [Anopheles funestus]XP_049286788.1 patj homolog [Anopheles funestus]XP_049286875.1 patj homolog [Anopheles funestus]XP_049286954.1 patj homolog [Anopheles funestus]